MDYHKWLKDGLRPDGRPCFDTPTGKFDLWSSILEDHGYEPLPKYVEPIEDPVVRPDLMRDFPLVFNSGTQPQTDFQSQHHGIEGLCRDNPEPTVEMNTADARARGIDTGDLVEVRTPRGAVPFRARITDNIVAGAVECNMGSGTPVGSEAWRRWNANELTDITNLGEISGFRVYKALLCEVARLEVGTAPRGRIRQPLLDPRGGEKRPRGGGRGAPVGSRADRCPTPAHSIHRRRLRGRQSGPQGHRLCPPGPTSSDYLGHRTPGCSQHRPLPGAPGLTGYLSGGGRKRARIARLPACCAERGHRPGLDHDGQQRGRHGPASPGARGRCPRGRCLVPHRRGAGRRQDPGGRLGPGPGCGPAQPVGAQAPRPQGRGRALHQAGREWSWIPSSTADPRRDACAPVPRTWPASSVSGQRPT